MISPHYCRHGLWFHAVCNFRITALLLFSIKFNVVTAQVTDCLAENIRTGNFALPTVLTYTEGVPVGENCVELCVNRTGSYPDGMFWYPGGASEGCRAYVRCQNWAAEVWLCPFGEIFDAHVGSCAEPDDDVSYRRNVQCKKPVPENTTAATKETTAAALTSEDMDDLSTEPTTPDTADSKTADGRNVTNEDFHIHEHVNQTISHDFPLIVTVTTTTTTITATTTTAPTTETTQPDVDTSTTANKTQFISYAIDDDATTEGAASGEEIVEQSTASTVMSTGASTQSTTGATASTTTVGTVSSDSTTTASAAVAGATDAYGRPRLEKEEIKYHFYNLPGTLLRIPLRNRVRGQARAKGNV